MGALQRKRRVVDATDLKEGQMDVYNLIKEHSKSFHRNMATLLNILVVGTAGTGKSFLIDALVGVLTEERVMVTATTGIAAFLICGRTIHSVIKLPRNKYKAYTPLEGARLLEIQEQFRYIDYLSFQCLGK